MDLKIYTPALLSTGISAIFSFSLNYLKVTVSPHWWLSLIFFILLFVSVQILFNYRSNSGEHSDILTATIWIKMILVLLVVFIYSVLNKQGLFAFSMHFIGHYILFTLFEIRYLQHKVKNESNKK